MKLKPQSAPHRDHGPEEFNDLNSSVSNTIIQCQHVGKIFFRIWISVNKCTACASRWYSDKYSIICQVSKSWHCCIMTLIYGFVSEERIVSGELKAAPPDISNMPPRSFSGPSVPPLTPLREPPYLAPEPPVEEDDEYEYPLFDCTCFQIYWSPFFADFCSNTLGMTLKHSSKKGTPAHGNLRPVKEGRVFKAIRKVGEKANKKGSELKREWTERRPTWNYQVISW